MSRISQGPAVSPHGLFNTTDNNRVAAASGNDFKTDDGRDLAYVFAGAVDIPIGVAVQSSPLVAAHQNLTGTTQAVGDKTITVTLGATAATLNQYANGFLEVRTGTGAGQRLKIASNPAASLSTTMVVTLEDAFVAATGTSSRFNLIADPYNGVVINPTSATAAPIGVTVTSIPAGNGGYIQTSGLSTVLFDAVGSTAAALQVTTSTTVAGAFTALDTTSDSTPMLGFTANAVAASQYGSVYLQL